MESGERVSNAWASCLQVGDNLSKGGLIPNVVSRRMSGSAKAGIFRDLPLGDVPASYQLVGGVTAHQGRDG